LISALACAFVARYPVDSRILPVLLFVAVSSILGFVINDIADAELDGKAGKLRNPVASGDLSVAAAWALVLVLLGGHHHRRQVPSTYARDHSRPRNTAKAEEFKFHGCVSTSTNQFFMNAQLQRREYR
jgi:hypothetical protein